MNKNDLRVKRTRKHLEKAMVYYLKKKDLYKITIKELTEAAEISRQTFYKHYETKEELYLACSERFFLELNERIVHEMVNDGITAIEDKYSYLFNGYRKEIQGIKVYMSIEDKDLIMKSLNKANITMINELLGMDLAYEDKQLVIDMMSAMVYVMMRKWVERKDHNDTEITHAISNVLAYISH